MPRHLLAAAILLAAVTGCSPPTPEKQFRRALRSGRVDEVQHHLDSGLSADARFEDGHAPLHVVAESIHASPEVARLLVERGVDVNATTESGDTAWDLVWGEATETLDDDDTGVLLVLLDAGAAPSPATTGEGRSRLHLAAEKTDSARLMSVLVEEHQGDVKSTDDNGWTALHVAAHENHVGSATGLLSAGADPNAETTRTVGKSWRYERGSRPLDVLRNSSRILDVREMRKVLAEHGGTENPAVNNRRR